MGLDRRANSPFNSKTSQLGLIINAEYVKRHSMVMVSVIQCSAISCWEFPWEFFALRFSLPAS